MNTPNIGIFGNGSVGSSLGKLIQHAGIEVTWGARDAAKAAKDLDSGTSVASFVDLVSKCDMLIVAVPWTAALDLLQSLPSLDGKIIVDATNPLHADWSPVLLGQESSAGEEIQKALPKARVVKAFNTIFAEMMTPQRIAQATAPREWFLLRQRPRGPIRSWNDHRENWVRSDRCRRAALRPLPRGNGPPQYSPRRRDEGGH